jgi:hypothetical protein
MAYSLHQIAERALREAGIDREYSGPFELINEAMSASDFPNIVSNVQNKFLLDGYSYEGKYWEPLVKTRTVKDFKNIRSIRLTEFGNLLQIPGAAAEAPEFTFRAEEAINYHVNLWGRRVEHLLSLLVDDDLNALQETTTAFGRSAARTISTDIMNIFVANPLYDVDGIATFTVGAPHRNAQALALNAANLATAVGLLKAQTDANGNRIQINRWTPIVPPALEYTAWQLWEQQGGRVARDAAPVVHRKMGMQEPIICTDLATLSNTCWFLVADPNELKSIEVAYLRGLEEPTYLSARGHWAQSLLGQYVNQNFVTEAACIWAWGYDVIDYRGLVRGNV